MTSPMEHKRLSNISAPEAVKARAVEGGININPRIKRSGHEFGDRGTTPAFDPWTVHFDNSANGLSRVPHDWERSAGAFRDGGRKF